MQVRLARTAGFCMGVRRAIELALDAVERWGEVYTAGPLVHNNQAIQMLRARGIEEEQDPPPSSAVLVRAHGLPPDELERLRAKGCTLIDATCPRVRAGQRKVEAWADEGRHIVIAGDRGHAEVKGLVARAGERASVISSCEEARSIELCGSAAFIAQTTFDASRFAEMESVLRSRVKGLAVSRSICPSTAERQEEIKTLARTAAAVVVVGGKHSANTCRLTEIASASGARVLHVETADELDGRDFEGCSSVVVTAGASTPAWVTQGVVERLRLFRGPLRGLLRAFEQVFVATSFFLALGAVALYYAASALSGRPPEPFMGLISFCFAFPMYAVNRLATVERTSPQMSMRAAFSAGHAGLLAVLALLCAVVGLAAAAWLDTNVFFALLAAEVAGGAYSLRILPRAKKRGKRLRDIPASKDIFIPAGWALVLVGLPCIASGELRPADLLAAGFVYLAVFAASVMLDMRDVEGDRLAGVETLPVLLGKKRAQYAVALAAIFLAVLLGAGAARGLSFGYWLMFLPAYVLIELRSSSVRHEFLWELIVGGCFIIAGALAGVWFFLGG